MVRTVTYAPVDVAAKVVIGELSPEAVSRRADERWFWTADDWNEYRRTVKVLAVICSFVAVRAAEKERLERLIAEV